MRKNPKITVILNISQLLDLCEFNQLPFDVNPNNDPYVWVARTEVLSKLEELTSNVIDSNLRETLVVTGTHGSGKSQCLLHLKWLIEQQYKDQCILIYIDNPTALGLKRTFVDVYQYRY